jgi:Rrf2 family nitric oxide-sensitive transcriptional repressor
MEMRLTDYTDYTLRVLMFCALNPERSVTIAELADSHAVSKNHLMKIVNDLSRQGLLHTTRGARRWPAATKACIRNLHR